MSYCSGDPQSFGFVSAMVRFVDCQAETLGSGAWSALATPGSTLSLVLTGFLTLFVALIGYNLLLGATLTVRSATLAMVKIGFVLALATSWPAYRTLVYDFAIDAPAQIVGEIGPRARVVGSDGTLLARLDLADRALADLAILGPGNPTATDPATIVPPPFAGFNAFALGGARILFLLAAIGSLAAIRIVAGLMLALGPLFIAFLLFDHTRSLFEGWIRVLAGAVLGAITAPIMLGLELALMEPWLAGILARRQAGEALPSVPTELLVVTSVFALVLLAVLFASVWLTRAFRLATVFGWSPRPFATRDPVSQPQGDERPSRGQQERTRAAEVVGVVMAAERREAKQLGAPYHSYDPQRLQVVPAQRLSRGEGLPAASVGRFVRRRARGRVSASAERRDRTA